MHVQSKGFIVFVLQIVFDLCGFLINGNLVCLQREKIILCVAAIGDALLRIQFRMGKYDLRKL